MGLTIRDFAGADLTPAQADGNFARNVVTSNTFSEGDLVYFTTGSAWALARANADTTLCDGVIIEASGTEFWVATIDGTIVDATTHGYGTAGQFIYLSQGTAGDGTATQPTSGLVQPVGKAITNDVFIFRVGHTQDLG